MLDQRLEEMKLILNSLSEPSGEAEVGWTEA